ncbi:MAG: hypothetical protein R6X11_04325 [Desulfonatronovibrio sp.]
MFAVLKTGGIEVNQFYLVIGPGGVKEFPSGKSFFPDVEAAGFLSGNEKFFLLARKSINYEEAYLNTLTNNCAD